MPRAKKRNKLTTEEWNTVLKYTSAIHFDQEMDLYDCGEAGDKWKDWETGRKLALSTGFDMLYDSIAYPFQHEGMTVEEGKILVALFKEFVKIKDSEEYLQGLIYDKE